MSAHGGGVALGGGHGRRIVRLLRAWLDRRPRFWDAACMDTTTQQIIFRDLNGNVLGVAFDGSAPHAHVVNTIRDFYVDLVKQHPSAGDTGVFHGPAS